MSEVHLGSRSPVRALRAPEARVGQMTSVMRAAAVRTGPKVLRVGLVSAGRVLEERVIKKRTSVTVGEGGRSTFVASTPDLALFERVGDRYVLNFTEAMTGRVAQGDRIADLGSLRAHARRTRLGFQVDLREDARGKISVGDATFLFQFVDAPPPSARPQLPLSVKGGLASQIDWTLTVIAAFSFLLHFGFVGSMYADWSDQPVDAAVTVQGLADMLQQIPPPAVESAETPDPAQDRVSKPSPAPEQPHAKPCSGCTAPSRTMSTSQAAALSERADTMTVALIGAMNSDSPLMHALASSNVPVSDLTSAANQEIGVDDGTQIKTSKGGGLVDQGHRSLTDLGQSQTDTHDAVVVRTVNPPPSTILFDPVYDPVGDVPGADGSIAALKPSFRSCYNKGLGDDPHMAGKIVLSIRVQPNGEVQTVSKDSGSGLSDKVEQCIEGKARNASFNQGRGGTLKVPVSFYTQ